MSYRKAEIVIVGGGAAGIAAARRLEDAKRDYILVEAKQHLGGRALTVNAGECSIDLGCGWLHSADHNPWVGIAGDQGRSIDTTPPPWERPSNPAGFPVSKQREFLVALNEFYNRTEKGTLDDNDLPLSHFLAPNDRWNPLINAVSTYYSGAELDRVSTRDLRCYQDSGVNWRVSSGYGSVVAAYASGLNVALNCIVQSIAWSGFPLRVSTSLGVIETDFVILTLPASIVAQRPELFDPPLPEKTAAAAGLPLGLADKLFLALEQAEEFEKDSRLFGRMDRTNTAIYHLRPFGRSLIECYFGGTCAENLETGGAPAFFDFAKTELTDLLGSNFGRRIRALPMHLWHADQFARGSYSYATPGNAGCRAVLASPVADRLFFAGEACSKDSFSTAHGAFQSGIVAAEQVIAAPCEQCATAS